MRLLRPALATALLVWLASTGCGGSLEAIGPTTIDARYQTGRCPFPVPEGAAVTCGTLTVPTDRARPDEGDIELAVATLHTPDRAPRPDPIVYLEGGPGGSAIASLPYWIGSPILEGRDLVLLDQRGTGFSEPLLDCAKEFDRTGGDDVDRYRDCHGRLSGSIDLSDFDTLAAADDLADLRHELGLDTVNLIGVSYGTRLALVTMARNPDMVRSIVVDSVYPPGTDALELQGVNAGGAIDALLDDCADDPDCDEAFPRLRERFYDLIDELDATPESVEVTDPDTGERSTQSVRGSDLVDLVFNALYLTDVIPDVPLALDRASRGGELQEVWDLLAGQDLYWFPEDIAVDDLLDFEDSVPSFQADGLYYAVTCSEDAPTGSLDEAWARADNLDRELREGVMLGTGFDIAVCGDWPVDPETLPPIAGAAPALVLAGSYDPITPPHWARRTHEALERSTYVEFGGVGHGVIGTGDCPDGLVAAFLDEPGADLDTSCAGIPGPPDFRTG